MLVLTCVAFWLLALISLYEILYENEIISNKTWTAKTKTYINLKQPKTWSKIVHVMYTEGIFYLSTYMYLIAFLFYECCKYAWTIELDCFIEENNRWMSR